MSNKKNKEGDEGSPPSTRQGALPLDPSIEIVPLGQSQKGLGKIGEVAQGIGGFLRLARLGAQ